MTVEQIISWLLEGDVSIQYQVHRDLLGISREDLQKKIASQGWGADYLSKRKQDGHWGHGFYQPKWTSSHYTLLDLRHLCISPNNLLIENTIQKILNEGKAEDGGILLMSKKSDVCVNGMFLNYASYFKAEENQLKSVIDCLLNELMTDGGFNCQSNRASPRHSSLHSTLSVLEGITAYERNGYTYRLSELKKAEKSSKAFILQHQFYISDRTGEIIKKDFLRLSYPGRWKYDILRALDYFRHSGTKWHDNMKPAIQILLKKRNKDGTWNLQAKYPGLIHFEMEKAGKPSRWNTLRAFRVLKHYKIL